MPENEKVKIIYTSITFVCGVKLYVGVYFVDVFIDLISLIRVVSNMINISSTYLV